MQIKPLDSFITTTDDSFLKRFLIFSIGVSAWALAQYKLRIVFEPQFNYLQSFFSTDYKIFASHIFSHALPVFICCMISLYILLKKGVCNPLSIGLLRKNSWVEGAIWGIVSSVVIIAMAKYMGIDFGFEPKYQKAFGDIVSNSSEELVYRVFIFSLSAYTFRGRAAGVLLTAILFGVVHNQYPPLFQFGVGIGSICFSLSYLRTYNIAAPILAHQFADMILDTIIMV